MACEMNCSGSFVFFVFFVFFVVQSFALFD